MTGSVEFLVKVCGITTAEDARFAAREGADLLGFVVHPPSPRHCAALAEASAEVRDRAVLVMVSDDPLELARTAAQAGIRRIQPHASLAARPRVAEALRREAFELLLPWPDEPGQESLGEGIYLWEPGSTGLPGGSGQANQLGFPPPGPFLLAGGLDGPSLAGRVRALPPLLQQMLRGFDAASRLEVSPGRKDPAKVRAFIQAARTCTSGGNTDGF